MMGSPESSLTIDSHFRTIQDLVTHSIPPVTVKLTHVGKWGLIDRILLKNELGHVRALCQGIRMH